MDKNSNTTSGSGMRSIAKTIPGPSASLEQATSRGVSAGQAANLALQVSFSEIKHNSSKYRVIVNRIP